MNLLISEATNPTFKNQTESTLEGQAVNIFLKYDRVFVLQSTLNIDRTVSFYRASKRTGKPFIMGLSSADICSKLKSIPNPIVFNDCNTYLNKAQNESKHSEIKAKYKTKLLSREQIAKMPKFTMQINSSMLGYLKKLNNIVEIKKSALIYSMWLGYKSEMQAFLDGVKSLGIEIIDLHVSGHADLLAIKELINRVNPDKIEFVHTESGPRNLLIDTK